MVASPSASRSYADALKQANAMAASTPGLWVAQVSATGSMRPYLGESCIVIMEPIPADQLKVGSLLAYNRENVSFVHAISQLTPQGVIVKGADDNIEELVPFTSMIGSVNTVIYFDPKTAPADHYGPMMLYASEIHSSALPAGAGTLRIVGASMIQGDPVTIYPAKARGEYTTSIPRDAAFKVTVGVPNTPDVPTADASIRWDKNLADQTLDIQVYNPATPEIGHVVLKAKFLP